MSWRQPARDYRGSETARVVICKNVTRKSGIVGNAHGSIDLSVENVFAVDAFHIFVAGKLHNTVTDLRSRSLELDRLSISSLDLFRVNFNPDSN